METIKPTDERAFEQYIETALVGSTREDRIMAGLTDPDKQNPSEEQYYWGMPKDMNKELAIDLRRLWHFLHATQQKELDKYIGLDMEGDISKRIAENIKTYGIIKVMREGVKHNNLSLKLFYPRPSASANQESKRLYKLNEFSLTRQQTFSLRQEGLELDLVLFINGLPIMTFELKNPYTHQTARYDAIKQYKETRSPKEPLLRFGTCLAHFALDQNEAYFCTRLNGKSSYFMPFNRGLANGQGAGNPVNPNGFKTSYIWEHLLRKETLSDIISNYVLLEFKNPSNIKLKDAEKLIFPRYHQLKVVEKLTQDVAKEGVGKHYLIEHSAGSGKSNSIAWLAYKLISLCPTSPTAKRSRGTEEQLFDSVIVVTDRRILDQQLSKTIRAFGQSITPKHAENSRELKEAIESNARIITTTIQKFPYICNTINNVSDHNFAIIIDEAHSSQSGITADKLNTTLKKEDNKEELSTDDIIEKLIEDRKMASNCSYFAFTATPKQETLQRFGTRNDDGSYSPFDLYSMKQAIEEGFILDVLMNYTTYESFYKIIKTTQDNPEYASVRAQKLLKRTVERHPTTIGEKAKVMLTHFYENIYLTNRLYSEAKAMVVTQDIECAIKYYLALKNFAKEQKISFGILIAFSGEKEIGGKTFTETGLNGFPDSDTAREFEKKENRILVVANKYLTGFDQPKLTAMYIDKALSGVLAVQALSRLNRSLPRLGKRSEDLFILDFSNTIEDIKEAFDPYYTDINLSGPIDPNILNDLTDEILKMDVFYKDDIEEFSQLYFAGKGPDQWTPTINSVAEYFNNESELNDNDKVTFKQKCKQFVKVYSRIAAIIEGTNKDWEKMYWFLRFLIPFLIVRKNDSSLTDLLDNVDYNTYALSKKALSEKITLDDNTATIDPTTRTISGPREEEKDPLDSIVEKFNLVNFSGWNATPDDKKSKIIHIAQKIINSKDYKDCIADNPDSLSTQKKYNEICDTIISENRKEDKNFYREYRNNEEFKESIRRTIIEYAKKIAKNSQLELFDI